MNLPDLAEQLRELASRLESNRGPLEDDYSRGFDFACKHVAAQIRGLLATSQDDPHKS